MTPAIAAPRRALDASWIIDASAGTGKTTQLVERVVEVIASGARVQQIAALTFTNAAAGEMKIRIRERLDAAFRAATDPDTRAHLAKAQEELEQAFVGTIHAFCKLLLHRRPVEAGIDPAFDELAAPEAYRMFGEVFRMWLRQRIAAGSPVLRRCFARMAEWRDAEPVRALQREAWKLVEWRDFPARWQPFAEFDRDRELEVVLSHAREFIDLRNRCKRQRDVLWSGLQPVADLLDRIERSREIGIHDYDAWEAELIDLPRQLRFLKSGYGNYGEGVTRDMVVRAWEKLEAEIGEFNERASGELAVDLRDEFWALVPLYEEAKRRAGRLDFMDLLIKARDLLRNDTARAYFRSEYRHIFVDEFQDTDPLQAEILLTLASDDDPGEDWRLMTPAPGKLFVVGDPKQSIYRFRRADVQNYAAIRTNFEASGVRSDGLHASSRSVLPIQEFVNAAFTPELPDYMALAGGREAVWGQPAIVALPMPTPYGTRNLSAKAIDGCSPQATAAFVEWLLHESNWKVTERDGSTRPVRGEDVCILFRRFSSGNEDIVQDYARALETRSIHHVLVGSKSFHQREEVAAIRTALRAIEWPEDELSVFATVRTFFAIPDSTLLKFKHAFGRFAPFRPLPDDLDEEFARIRDAFELIVELHRNRNQRPLADTIGRFLDYTRAQVAFAFRKGGERVLANVYRLVDLARDFERTSATSFRSFVALLEDEADAGEAGEAPILEDKSSGVRLMTVHKAKGLEFSVVILADVTAKLCREACDRHVDASRKLCVQRLCSWAPPELLESRAEEQALDRDEGVRLAYVAATRARDLLVVCAVGEPEYIRNAGKDSWLSPLWDALYPPPERTRVSSKAPGCPKFEDRTVMNRPLDAGPDEVSVKPGSHRPVVGNHRVVWFDPSVLTARPPKSGGLEHEAVLSGTPEEINRGLEQYRDWETQRAERIAGASVQRFQVVRATDVREQDAHVEVLDITADGMRPVGRTFGRLVHAILEATMDPAEVENAARAHARGFGATDREVAAAAEAVRHALEHPLLKAAATAPRVHRELPVIAKLEDGRLMEGRVDLAFFDGTRWTVIDFKTGIADKRRNREQLHVYAKALAEATRQEVRAVLVEI